MRLQPLPLFSSRRDIILFAVCIILLFLASMSLEYRGYKEMTRFNDAVIPAKVLQQYDKTKAGHTYQVLKLRLPDGPSFFMTAPASLRDLSGYEVEVWFHTDRLSFLEYMKGFFAHGYVETVSPRKLLAYRLADRIIAQHADRQLGALFAALFTATPIPQKMRHAIGALGVGHLLAISGFHIGLLSTLLFVLLRYPYRTLQSRWFPWRNSNRDLFFLTLVVMMGYVYFLQMTPSVLRAYGMMLIGFLFYDRGIKVVSMHSLLLTVLILMALWPRLLFSLGFWLSVSGVFYVFMFLGRFETRGKIFTFVGLHLWVYAMMLPLSIVLFGTFSPLHPFSVLWTMLFILFYPLSLGLHLVGFGGLLDGMITGLLHLPQSAVKISVGYAALAVWTGLSLLALKSETVKRLLPYLAAAVFIGAVYQIA